jgi:cytochrome bd-type quinol oxidase subunit 2
LKFDDDSMTLLFIAGIVVVSIVAAFAVGFIFGNRGQGVVFDRDQNGRISGIFTVPNVMR